MTIERLAGIVWERGLYVIQHWEQNSVPDMPYGLLRFLGEESDAHFIADLALEMGYALSEYCYHWTVFREDDGEIYKTGPEWMFEF